MVKIALWLFLCVALVVGLGCDTGHHTAAGPPSTFYVECLAVLDCFKEAQEVCGEDFEIRSFPVSLFANLLLTTTIVECEEE
jgi:hypothetical protein